MITNTEYKTFKDADYTVLPMCREIMAPGESPLSLYAKIANQQNNFLFESVEGGDRWAQYSIIGFGEAASETVFEVIWNGLAPKQSL